ncbi:MAG: diadenylate cyclase CdaA [Victivallales bacterium]|nr:diadenylate cyclase CdaA [Victivallales bacterium]
MHIFDYIFENPLYLLRLCSEITVLFFLIYSAMYYLRGTRGAYSLAGLLIALIMLTFLADFLEFEVIKWLLNGLWTIFSVALIVIFQPELRRAFAQLGSRSFMKKMRKKETIDEVVTAVINLSNQRTGALIVFERAIGMKAIINSGIALESRLNHFLIEAMFHTKSPLHDGGVIIRGNTIVAAHCIFPLTHESELQRTLGTRHRAAIGITEETDAVAVVVSEESGMISLACRGRLKRNVSPDVLSRYLNALLISGENDSLAGVFAPQPKDEDDDTGFSEEPIEL